MDNAANTQIKFSHMNKLVSIFLLHLFIFIECYVNYQQQKNIRGNRTSFKSISK